MLQNKFKAILLIGEIKKYIAIVIAYFNEITAQGVIDILGFNKDSSMYPQLLQAAMLSTHWDWDNIAFNMQELNFDEEACHVIIKSKKLTGSQMVMLLKMRIAAVGTTSIGPLISAVTDTQKLSGPELLSLLYLYKNDSLIEHAKPQLEEYIEGISKQRKRRRFIRCWENHNFARQPYICKNLY